MHPGPPQGLRLVVVAGGERVFAADAAQDPEPGHDVRGPGGQLALLVPVAALPPVQRAEYQAGRPGQQRRADQHDQAQRGRGDQQHHGDGDQRRDRAAAPAGHVDGVADGLHVRGAHADHLAGGDQPGECVAEPGGLACDQLHGPVGRVQEHAHHAPVPQQPGPGGDQAQGQYQQAGLGERPGLPDDQPVDRGADRGGGQGLGDHPDAAPQHAEPDRALLAADQPGDVPGGRPEIRRARVSNGQGTHIAAAYRPVPGGASGFSAALTSSAGPS
jgi:hypothetical protein